MSNTTEDDIMNTRIGVSAIEGRRNEVSHLVKLDRELEDCISILSEVSAQNRDRKGKKWWCTDANTDALCRIYMVASNNDPDEATCLAHRDRRTIDNRIRQIVQGWEQ